MDQLEDVQAEIDRFNQEKSVWKAALAEGNFLAPGHLKALNAQLGPLYALRDEIQVNRGITARPRRGPRPGDRLSISNPRGPSKTPAQRASEAQELVRKEIPPEFEQWCQKAGAGKRKILPWWKDVDKRASFETHPLGASWKTRLEGERKKVAEAEEKARAVRVSAFMDKVNDEVAKKSIERLTAFVHKGGRKGQ